jgi:hypothetical protein
MKGQNHAKLDELLKECEQMFENPHPKNTLNAIMTPQKPEEDYSFLQEKYVVADVDTSMQQQEISRFDELYTETEKLKLMLPKRWQQVAENIQSSDTGNVRDRINCILELIE